MAGLVVISILVQYLLISCNDIFKDFYLKLSYWISWLYFIYVLRYLIKQMFKTSVTHAPFWA